MTQIDPKTRQAVERFLALLQGKYDIAQAIVFGSRVRGTQRPDSDADVAILLPGKPHGLLPAKLDMADVAFDVLLEAGVLISPLPVWTDEWAHPETYSNPSLLRNIAREGVQTSSA